MPLQSPLWFVESKHRPSGQDQAWVISDSSGQGMYESTTALSAALPPTGKAPIWGTSSAVKGKSPAPDVEWAAVLLEVGPRSSLATVGNRTTMRSLIRTV